ncbi:hypothetical protein FF38_10614 [Lucilia cuprina]|uniref:Uncharacterized protein n=1 Tax=Lucilia cuprina TaxID=7375 RepID=A0A0L0BZB1_LUCCU|nr:hypothetical protein FF38_10614 [Lucilia cuprina]
MSPRLYPNTFKRTDFDEMSEKELPMYICKTLEEELSDKKEELPLEVSKTLEDVREKNATFHIPEIGEILEKNRTRFSLSKVLEDFIRSNIIRSKINNLTSDVKYRVSNGPIENYFKDIKRNQMQGEKMRLGRFVRLMAKFTNYKITKIKICFSRIFDKPITPNTRIRPANKTLTKGSK